MSLFALLIVRWIEGKKKKRKKGRKNAGTAKRDGRIETRETLCKLDEQREKKEEIMRERGRMEEYDLLLR